MELDEQDRERAFFGDEDYTLLSKAPEEEEKLMSMTMAQRQVKKQQDRVTNLRRDIS